MGADGRDQSDKGVQRRETENMARFRDVRFLERQGADYAGQYVMK